MQLSAFNRMTLLEYLNVTYEVLTKDTTMEDKIKVNLCVCHREK